MGGRVCLVSSAPANEYEWGVKGTGREGEMVRSRGGREEEEHTYVVGNLSRGKELRGSEEYGDTAYAMACPRLVVSDTGTQNWNLHVSTIVKEKERKEEKEKHR